MFACFVEILALAEVGKISLVVIDVAAVNTIFLFSDLQKYSFLAINADNICLVVDSLLVRMWMLY